MSTETGATTVWPPSKHAWQKLHELGLVKYGGIIKWSLLQELFGIQDATSWKFRSEWFALHDLLEESGFLVTEAGQKGEGFRIFDREEMANVVKTREYRKANDSLSKSLTLSRVPREGLSEEEAKKLDHWETKAAVVGATAKVLLRRRELPSPETAIKSIKQVYQ